jgi:PAT family beta-lactamase induction signal transducer AmpG
VTPRSPLALRLLVLGSLYVVQGLPFGFQATALPVLLRREGTSLEAIGLAQALAFPWLLKLLWAPAIDAFWSKRVGRRRTWIVPLTALLATAAFAASLLDPRRELETLLAVVLVMNLLAATLDIAVDGLAVDLLAPHELGRGNAVQVGGYKLGMVASGGLLLAFVSEIGWHGFFSIVAGVVAVVCASTLFWREPEASRGEAPVDVRGVLDALFASTKVPGFVWVLLFIATYKLGESAADAMFKPFLVDRGYDEAQIGVWVGTWGMIASLLGSISGGLVRSRVPIVTAIAFAALLRALPILGQAWLAWRGPTDETVIAVTLGEHFFGGVLTTLMFAFMMSQVDRRIGATHFTALASVEAIGKAPGGLLSGVLARALGYTGTFALAFVLSLAFLGLLVPLRRYAKKA